MRHGKLAAALEGKLRVFIPGTLPSYDRASSWANLHNRSASVVLISYDGRCGQCGEMVPASWMWIKSGRQPSLISRLQACITRQSQRRDIM